MASAIAMVVDLARDENVINSPKLGVPDYFWLSEDYVPLENASLLQPKEYIVVAFLEVPYYGATRQFLMSDYRD